MNLPILVSRDNEEFATDLPAICNISEIRLSNWESIRDKIILFKDKNNITDKEFFKFWNFLGYNSNEFISAKKIVERISEINTLFTYNHNDVGIYVLIEDKLNYFLPKYISAITNLKVEIKIITYYFEINAISIYCIFFSFKNNFFILGIFESIKDVFSEKLFKIDKIILDGISYEIKNIFSRKEFIFEADNNHIFTKIFSEIRNSYSNQSLLENLIKYEKIVQKESRLESLSHIKL